MVRDGEMKLSRKPFSPLTANAPCRGGIGRPILLASTGELAAVSRGCPEVLTFLGYDFLKCHIE